MQDDKALQMKAFFQEDEKKKPAERASAAIEVRFRHKMQDKRTERKEMHWVHFKIL